MGLDMYLDRKVYIWSDDRNKLTISGTKEKINLDKVKYIIEEAGYWRKANQIHNWFVQNVQDGDDDCGDYYVSPDKMKELLQLCKEVKAASKLVKGKVQNGTRWENGKSEPIMEDGEYIEDPSVAQELLPTGSGFFFGSTDYDQWYLQDIEDTIKILEEALEDEEGDYQYHSSW